MALLEIRPISEDLLQNHAAVIDFSRHLKLVANCSMQKEAAILSCMLEPNRYRFLQLDIPKDVEFMRIFLARLEPTEQREIGDVLLNFAKTVKTKKDQIDKYASAFLQALASTSKSDYLMKLRELYGPVVAKDHTYPSMVYSSTSAVKRPAGIDNVVISNDAYPIVTYTETNSKGEMFNLRAIHILAASHPLHAAQVGLIQEESAILMHLGLLLGFDTDQSTCCIKTKKLDGTVLADLENRVLTPQVKTEIVAAAMGYLQEMLKKGIYLGDLSANNIMVGKDNSVRLISFVNSSFISSDGSASSHVSKEVARSIIQNPDTSAATAPTIKRVEQAAVDSVRKLMTTLSGSLDLSEDSMRDLEKQGAQIMQHLAISKQGSHS